MKKSQSYPWIVSPNWPIDHTAYRLPPLRHPLVKSEPSPSSSISADQPSKNLNIALDAPELESQIQDSNSEELLCLCEALLNRARQTEAPKSFAFLQIPPRVTREQHNPYAFHTLRRAFHRIRVATRYDADHIPIDTLRRFTQFLVCIDRGNALPDSAPAWLRSLSSTIVKPVHSPSKSLVWNVMLGSLRLLEYSDFPRDQERLMELCELVNISSDGSELKQWLDRLPEEQREVSEIVWARRVMEPNPSSWMLQQGLIKARLIANRLSCEPWTSFNGSQHLTRGDLARLTAERAFTDRSTKEWSKKWHGKHRFGHGSVRNGVGSTCSSPTQATN